MHDTQDTERGERKRRDLRRHRSIAFGLLVVAALLFLATHFVEAPGFWVLLLRAGAEAGLVGGLADWFAVTALFRRPFGLPIPHTAIIPRNKERIGEGLGRFVEQNFLDPAVIEDKLRRGNVAQRLGRWLQSEDNSRLLAEQLLALGPEVVDSLDDREVREFFREAFSEQVGRADLVPVLSRLLRLLTESRQHQRLFDRGLELARSVLARNEDAIYERVEDRSAWWVPRRVDQRLAKSIVAGVEDLLSDLAQHEHPVRQRFDRAVAELIERLERSPDFRARVEELKAQLMASPEVHTAFGSVWDELKHMLLGALARPDSVLGETLAKSLQALGRTLEQDSDAQRRLNRRIEGVVSGLVVPFRTQIGAFMREVVRGWDTATVTERIELEVGRDLQYIRVNGTLVGALAGCVLFLLSGLAH
jgi:uncharacterized membrane-anchored protein YjiN (DUF445 family)